MASIPDPVVSSLSAVAQWFRVDARTAHNWKNNGMPGEQGAWNLQDITAWRIERGERAAGPVENDLEREEFLKIQAERQTRQVKLAQLLGDLIERSAVVSLLRQFSAVVRSRLQAIPGELASSIPPEHRHDLMIELEQKISLILTEMAAWLLPKLLTSKTSKRPNGGSKSNPVKKSGKRRAANSRRGKSRAD